ncbi:MAG: hypothetical protein Athens071416_381 [Parcubacteria group bacterium Athens0714_16]|nr:MAG: hypothetical protein Athens071416_381 [Parcubacteria group bacterium Athens0714_16]
MVLLRKIVLKTTFHPNRNDSKPLSLNNSAVLLFTQKFLQLTVKIKNKNQNRESKNRVLRITVNCKK